MLRHVALVRTDVSEGLSTSIITVTRMGEKGMTVLLLKKTSFSEEVCQQVRPQGSRPPRLYWMLKIHKPGVPLSKKKK
jgi:hypothetical protein